MDCLTKGEIVEVSFMTCEEIAKGIGVVVGVFVQPLFATREILKYLDFSLFTIQSQPSE